MQDRLILFVAFVVLVASIISCAKSPTMPQPPNPEPPKLERVTHDVKCQGCGNIWQTTVDAGIEPEPIFDCPMCPLDVCMEMGMKIIAMGSMGELARHQPTKENLAKVAELEKWMEQHVTTCPDCQRWGQREQEKQRKKEEHERSKRKTDPRSDGPQPDKSGPDKSGLDGADPGPPAEYGSITQSEGNHS